MKQDHQHIDNKLRELESQSLPDLSKIDEHWQQLKNNLQPVNINGPARAPRKYSWWIVAAAAIISILFIAIYTADNKQSENDPIAVVPNGSSKQIASDTVPAAIEKDTVLPSTKKKHREPAPAVETKTPKKHIVPKDSTISNPKKNPFKKLYGKKQLNNDTLIPKKKNPPKSKRQSIIETVKSSDKETKIVATSTEITLDSVSPSYAAELEAFFSQLEKKAQEFIIDNKRDTILLGEEGTALLIPANAFTSSNKKVSIQLKEYYSYEDIISNRLNTTSNGAPLITGGMIHISAQSDGRETRLRPGKSIRWFVPGGNESLNGMQLFTNEEKSNNNSSSSNGNKNIKSKKSRNINWKQSEQQFLTNQTITEVKVLDLRNEPFKVKEKAKGEVAYFGLSPYAVISKDKATELLQEKYGYYKVKVKRQKSIDRNAIVFNFSGKYNTQSIGDSAWVEPYVAANYKLKSTETRITTSTGFNFGFINNENSAPFELNPVMQKLSNKFSVDINSLGWMNCDKFYNIRNSINYYVDLNDNGENYCAMLVFAKRKGMIMGQIINQRIVFYGVPEGEEAIVVCMGIQNGEAVSAMQSVNLSKTPLSNLKFEETSPEEFKKQAASIDKL